MKKTVDSNILEASSIRLWEDYTAHVSGERVSYTCVVSSYPLGTAAQTALKSSMERLGYSNKVTFISLYANEADTLKDNANLLVNASDSSNSNSNTPKSTSKSLESASHTTDHCLLGADSLFQLVEGIDPIVIIATDREAARALTNAYHTTAAVDAASRFFGRDYVGFSSFENMLTTPEQKQRAWALLKRITPMTPALS